MKKYLFLFITLLFVNTSCTDLELFPEDGFTEFELFKDPEAYRCYLAKIYAAYTHTGQDGPSGDADITIVEDEGFTSYNRAYWKAQELTTDEAVIAWDDAGIRRMHEHTWTSDNQFIRVLYYRIAYIVSLANDFIKQSSDERLAQNGIVGTDVENIKTYRIEARFLRAMAYWHALDFFGSIPIVEEISTDPPTQNSPQEIFDFIEKELNEIEAEIAAPRQNEYGRADRAALWMLQAKLYLNAEHQAGQKKYSECIEACKKIMDAGYTLNDDYRTLFVADNHTSNEIIFSLISDGIFAQNWGGTTFLVHGAIGGDMVAEDYGVAAGWAGIRTTSTFVDKFEDISGNTDRRANFFTINQTKEIEDIAVFQHGYAVPKYTNKTADGVDGSDPTHVDTDYPMFRLADAYLMYAEAVLRGGEGGDTGTALGLINELRERAYGDASGNISAAELDLPFILDERSRELHWEATRRVDLIRFGEFSDAGIWPWKGNVKEGRLTDSFRDLFPIPASDLLANPALKQNPGY